VKPDLIMSALSMIQKEQRWLRQETDKWKGATRTPAW
jgi:hypothetical protein